MTPIFLGVIEFVQLSGIILNLSLINTWGENRIFSYICKFASYACLIFPDGFIPQIVFLSIFLSIFTLTLLILLVLWKSADHDSSQSSSVAKVVNKVLLMVLTLERTIFLIPSYYVIFSTFNPPSGK